MIRREREKKVRFPIERAWATISFSRRSSFSRGERVWRRFVAQGEGCSSNGVSTGLEARDENANA